MVTTLLERADTMEDIDLNMRAPPLYSISTLLGSSWRPPKTQTTSATQECGMC